MNWVKFPRVSVRFELEHPHDLLTRFFLVDVELFAGLLEKFGDAMIVRQIDLLSLKNESPTFVDGNLKEVISDLFFSAKFKNDNYSKIFMFFEHQSSKDNSIWLRFFRRFTDFYESYNADPKNKIGAGGKFPYPLVVVLYHGKTSWNKLLQLRDFLSLPPDMDCNVLWFPAIIIDISRIRREDLKNAHPALLALLDTLISYSDGTLSESFDRIVDYFTTIKKDRRTYGWLSSLTRYFSSLTQIGVETVTKTISKIFNKRRTKKMVMSTMEKLYTKGIKKGVKRGREEERLESKIDAVLKILTVRFKKVPAEIKNAVKSYKDPIALDSLIEQAAICETLSEFEQDIAHR
ncbi:MAG: Rpn family recombination-promoting nuclease/putative transposase [Planctomycetaceae bacterium]|jgi:predicted transposase YdaD|nr:Rpn family recombination-promoting nuclease/putative transposase [Planctomycetaceae bacterium]